MEWAGQGVAFLTRFLKFPERVGMVPRALLFCQSRSGSGGCENYGCPLSARSAFSVMKHCEQIGKFSRQVTSSSFAQKGQCEDHSLLHSGQWLMISSEIFSIRLSCVRRSTTRRHSGFLQTMNLSMVLPFRACPYRRLAKTSVSIPELNEWVLRSGLKAQRCPQTREGVLRGLGG